MPNMRQLLIDLSNQAKDIHARERRITLDSIELVGRLDRLNAAVTFCMTTAQFAREIGLTENKWWKRVQVSRLLTRFPEAKTMLMDGDTEVSHLATSSTGEIPFGRPNEPRDAKLRSRRHAFPRHRQAQRSAWLKMCNRALPQGRTM